MMYSDIMSRRVVKFGGSTLSVDDNVATFVRWLSGQPAAQTIVVVGGGTDVRLIAEEQLEDDFGDEEAHWRCIDVMHRNARLVQVETGASQWLERLSELTPPSGQAETLFLDPRQFMKDDARGKSPLPVSWDVS